MIAYQNEATVNTVSIMINAGLVCARSSPRNRYAKPKISARNAM